MRLVLFITFAWQPIVRFTSMFGFSSVIFFYLLLFLFLLFSHTKSGNSIVTGITAYLYYWKFNLSYVSIVIQQISNTIYQRMRWFNHSFKFLLCHCKDNIIIRLCAQLLHSVQK